MQLRLFAGLAMTVVVGCATPMNRVPLPGPAVEGPRKLSPAPAQDSPQEAPPFAFQLTVDGDRLILDGSVVDSLLTTAPPSIDCRHA